MARAIDFLGEIQKRDPKVVSGEFGLQASEPSLLHYYCLTHWVAPKLKREYGNSSVKYSYFVVGQLVSILAEIPFLDRNIWSSIKHCSERYFIDNQIMQMEHPHPSFIFPVLLEAVFESNIQWNNFDVAGMEKRANALLKFMKLPLLHELREYRDHLYESMRSTFGNSTAGKGLLPLFDSVKGYADSIGWADRLANPMKGFTRSLPVPILFQDGDYLDGTLLSIETSFQLAELADRCAQFCRFSFARDIVE
jgi:hypothetical protein